MEQAITALLQTKMFMQSEWDEGNYAEKVRKTACNRFVALLAVGSSGVQRALGKTLPLRKRRGQQFSWLIWKVVIVFVPKCGCSNGNALKATLKRFLPLLGSFATFMLAEG